MNICPLCDCKIQSVKPVHYRSAEWVTTDGKSYVNLFSFAFHIWDKHLKARPTKLGRQCFCGSPVTSIEEFKSHLLKVGNHKERLEHLRFHALGRKT